MSNSLKKILITGAGLLMLSSVGAGISNVSNAHADELLNVVEKEDKMNQAYDLQNMIHTDRTDPNMRSIDETSGDPQLREEFKEVHNSIFKPGYKKGNSEERYNDFKALKHLDGTRKAYQILHIRFNRKISRNHKNYKHLDKSVKRNRSKYIHKTNKFKRLSHKRSQKPRRKLAKHFKSVNKHTKRLSRVNKKSHKHTRRTRKYSKKLSYKLSQQLKNDKKALKSRKAKHNYKLRKSLNKAIMQLQKKMKMFK